MDGEDIRNAVTTVLLQFTNLRERIIVTFNGGWTYSGAEYIWQRIEEDVFSDQQNGTL